MGERDRAMLAMCTTGRSGGCLVSTRQQAKVVLRGTVATEGGLLGTEQTWRTPG